MGQFTTLLGQSFRGIRMVKAYGMEEYEKGRIAAIVERVFTLSFRSARIRALASPIMETLGGVAIAVVIVYGGHQVIEGRTDPGSFISFITALLLAYEPMKRLANLNASLQEGLASAQRLFDLLDTDGDGKLSVAEIQAPSKRWFKRYDKNGDKVMEAGEVRVAKVPTTPDNQAFGVLSALDEVGARLDRVAGISHGTTATTNALLERKGARTGKIGRAHV